MQKQAVTDLNLHSITPEDRARARYRLAAWATLTTIVSRGLSLFLIVLGVRLTVNYLGATRFGVWATFASMAAMLSLLDLGVGNALVNRIAHAVAADDDPNAVTRIVTGGSVLLAGMGMVTAAGLLVPALLLPWGTLLKLVEPAVASEARQAAAVFAIFFGVNLFSSGLLRILAGQQRSHEGSLLSACATLLACISLYCAASRQAGVPWLLVATFGVQTLGGLGASALLLRRQLISTNGWQAAVASEWPQLLRAGSLFLLLQLGTMLGWGGDSVILAVSKGASEVAVFAVGLRLFQFASQPFAILNAPLWAAYADASARGDARFVRQTLKRSFLLSVFGAVVASGCLLAAGPALIFAWTHGTIIVPNQVLALFAIWTVFEIGGNAFAMYLNGTGIVREQVWVVAAFCAVALPMKLFAAAHAGASGLLAATILSYGITVIGLYTTVFRQRVLKPIADHLK